MKRLLTAALTVALTVGVLLAACGESAPEAAAPAPITIALGGDTMLARGVSHTIERRGARHVWGDVLPLLRGADLAFVNLECVIAEGGRRFDPDAAYHFRASPGALDALTLAGIDGVALANNHAMDYGGDALAECLRRLDEEGIAHTGAGPTLGHAARPAILDAGGLRVGLVSFADHPRLYAATDTSVGTNLVAVTTEGADFERVRDAIGAARRAGADVVIFSIHWGPNWRERPEEHFRAFARAVLDAGADVFWGHSAHAFQGIEIHDGKPILHDTGDLLDDYAVNPAVDNHRQLLFVLRADRDGVRAVELVPLVIHRARVNRAHGEHFDATARRLTRLSAEMGTTIERRGDRLVVTDPLH